MDRQLPLEPTIRIDPSTLVEHMPGTDAVCICNGRDERACMYEPCLWPFCDWKHQPEQEDRMSTTVVAPPDTPKAQAIRALQSLLASHDEKIRLDAAKALVEACRP